ncbi:alpha/beta hydrolase fold domain-containing protein [Chryseobacterium sp. MMS23-Vi53]|uniref:alpha/beta hydrolase fold domain-containing protein n=1 Tax=Chryseobacterium sp. MMS23-Vi53 TaxID=3386644 RepID=UPI0039ECA9C3
MKKNLLLLLLFITFSSCRKTIDLGKDATFKIEQNISYGEDPNQKIDIYIPGNKPKKDVFIIIHGGGWRGGNKSQLTFFTYSLMQKFPRNVFVNMNYRLASQKHFALPDQTQDIQNVMNLVEKKLKYKPKFILLGNSAGGHLSMFYAYHSDKNKRVKAVVNIVGPADLNDRGFKNYDDYAFVEKHLVDPKLWIKTQH